MRFWVWIGHSGTSAVIAEQFGLAMMPLWSGLRRALISGMASGTSGCMRKAGVVARTAPERHEGALVFAVRLVVAFMGRSYAGARRRRQTVFGSKMLLNKVEPDVIVTP